MTNNYHAFSYICLDILKLHTNKACDHIEWNFIYSIFQALRSNHIWVNRNRWCISQCCFSMHPNVRPFGFSILTGDVDRVILSLHPYTSLLHISYLTYLFRSFKNTLVLVIDIEVPLLSFTFHLLMIRLYLQMAKNNLSKCP